MDPRPALLATLPPGAAATVAALDEVITATAPSLSVSVKWGNLTYAREGRNLLAIIAHRRHVNLQLWNGAGLEGFGLEGTGKAMRHLKLPLGGGIDRGAVAALVRAAQL